ncbi:DUF4168 domain-containing protein [Parasphingorhabdus sp.]|uniref:DUF4168 domain-containing protein n=1 Tax=Parasphingorhabdus sp. TaxID=2709688 RepID=UPI0030010699
MKSRHIFMIGAVALFGVSAASAQSAPKAPPAAEAPSAAPAAPDEQKVTITPQDIDNFAKAVIAVNEIQKDSSLNKEQKETAMTAAVESRDLDTFKFNTIVQASQTNAELKKRVQLAINQNQQQRQQ